MRRRALTLGWPVVVVVFFFFLVRTRGRDAILCSPVLLCNANIVART
jgi:hypothetical protein